ncbi:hypothetical protein BDD12DRAFT_99637 [Trichophaea hybrida]|nr:hypothetical protein BDD12DRAFT_99637 [Trichophaea hybrida]
MAFWDSPSSSSSSLNLDLEGIPVSMLEEHAKVLEEDLATMTFDEQAAARREIAQVRWQISQLNQRQPKPPKQYPNDNLDIGIMNPGFNFNSATPLDSEHSYGNTSNNEDSLFFYNGAGMSGNMNGSGILNRKRQRESLGTEDDTEFDTKSPRFTPSPRNFASSPSPARNGYMQNDNDAEMARLLMLNTPGSQQQQLLLDEEYARHLQEQFNNGSSKSFFAPTGYPPVSRERD